MLNLLLLILIVIMMMMSTAFFTLFERKLMGIFHYRKGPNKVSFWGMLQPFSDSMKLLTKEFFTPLKSNNYIYMISPLFMLILISLLWIIYPFTSNIFMFKFNMLFFLSILSMSSYSIMLMGWTSASSFSMIGAIRTVAQTISYEIIFSISLMMMMILLSSLNFYSLMYYNMMFVFFMYPNFVILLMFISMLAEINRTPFDLSESESELVSGFNIEYSSAYFTLIFLSEYSSIIMMSILLTMIFFYSSFLHIFFYMKIIFMLFFITWIRITFPRLRYDKLMYLCWFFLVSIILNNIYLYFIFN
uniref:NADH-ubiquinone oxidoreductase chain 1 n=1 Tax=Pselaphanus sp. QL-2013 TaxID=1421598 RepID=A0A0A6ZL89_9HYME|nr:NADH dehydrogenase subunit 1 [Pselaphanus sp. QL-2013]